MALELVGLGILLLVAFGPSLVYMVRIRNLERFNRNPWMRMFFAFGWGAIASVVIAVILELWLPGKLASFRPARVPEDVFLATVIAPLAEESAKVIGVILLSTAKFWEEEDGLVYGAACGLGFAATENLLYELNALQTGGLIAWAVVAIMRIFTSTLLHASATAISGWGVSKSRIPGGGGIGALIGYLVIAMFLHGLFNLFASLGEIYTDEAAATLISLLVVFIFAGAVYRFTRMKIQELDRRASLLQPIQPF
jgi:RsiW-degrading membrane proteinase PrsW (M82 family)